MSKGVNWRKVQDFSAYKTAKGRMALPRYHHLEGLTNDQWRSQMAITVWLDGTYRKWDRLSAHYAENDPDWLVTIQIEEGGQE